MQTMVNGIVNRRLHCVTKNFDIIAKKNVVTEAVKLIVGISRQADEILPEPGSNEDKSS